MSRGYYAESSGYDYGYDNQKQSKYGYERDDRRSAGNSLYESYGEVDSNEGYEYSRSRVRNYEDYGNYSKKSYARDDNQYSDYGKSSQNNSYAYSDYGKQQDSYYQYSQTKNTPYAYEGYQSTQSEKNPSRKHSDISNKPYDNNYKSNTNNSNQNKRDQNLNQPYDASYNRGYSAYISNQRYDIDEEENESESVVESEQGYDIDGDSSDDSLDISVGEEIDDNLRVNRFKSRKRFMKGEEVTSWEIAYSVKKFRANMKKIMKRNKLNLRTVFRMLDVDNDGFISYIDFCRGLEKMGSKHKIYLNMKDLDLLTCLFERLDEIEKKRKLSFNSFREAIYKKRESREEIAKLLRRVCLRVNQKDEGALKAAFAKFDKDSNGIISFSEFSSVLRQFELPPEDIDALFMYFEQGKNHIEYQEFSKQLFEDQQIQENISLTIREYSISQAKTLRQLFNAYCDTSTQLLTVECYVQLMRGIGFMYNTQIIEESFDYFDLDKNSAITFEEFDEAVNSSIQDRLRASDSPEAVEEYVKNIVKKVRSDALKKGIDIAQKLVALSERYSNHVSFTVFLEVLVESFVDIQYIEKEILFSFFQRENNQDEIDVMKLVESLQSEKFDLEFVRERLQSELKRFNITYAQLFTFFDTDGSGSISFMEFSELLDVIQVKLSKEDASTAFATFDINQDGSLSLEEFIKVLEGKPLSHTIDMQKVLDNINLLDSTIVRPTLRNLVGVATPATTTKESEKEIVVAIDSSTRYSNLNPESLEGKVSIHAYSEVYLRRVEKMPEVSKDFLKKDMANIVMYTVQKSGIDFFNEFLRVDPERQCFFIGVETFKKVLNTSNIFFSEEMLTYVFSYYEQTDEPTGIKYFPYLDFLQDIYNPFQLFKRVFLIQMHINEVSLRDMIIHIVKGSPENDEKKDQVEEEKVNSMVTSNELLQYCRRSQMFFSRDQFTYVWGRFNQLMKEAIDIEDFANALEIPLNYNPSRQSLEDSKRTAGQLALIDEFSVALNKNAKQRKVDIMEMFLYFDSELSLSFSDSSQLQRIANILQIKMQPIEIRAIFTYLQSNEKLRQMQYIQLVKRSQQPQFYLASVLRLFIAMEEWTLQQFFSRFAKNDRWNLVVLKEVIGYSKLTGIQTEIEVAFNEWCRSGEKSLSIQDLSEIVQISVTDSAKEIQTQCVDRRAKNVEDLLARVNILPQVNERHYLSYYINKPSDDLYLTKKVVLGEAIEVDFLSKKQMEEQKLILEKEKQVEEATNFLLTGSQSLKKSQAKGKTPTATSGKNSPMNASAVASPMLQSRRISTFSAMSSMHQSKKLIVKK